MTTSDVLWIVGMVVLAALAALTAWPSTRDRAPIVHKMSPVARYVFMAVCALVAIGALVLFLLTALGAD